MVRVRLVLAWILLVGSLVGWALSLAGVIAKGEPQFVLSLSWAAITLTAWDIMSTTDVRKQQDDTP